MVVRQMWVLETKFVDKPITKSRNYGNSVSGQELTNPSSTNLIISWRWGKEAAFSIEHMPDQQAFIKLVDAVALVYLGEDGLEYGADIKP